MTFVSKKLQERVVEVEGLSFQKTAITYAGCAGRRGHRRAVGQFREQYGTGKGAVVLLAIGLTALPYKAEGLKLLIGAVRIPRETYPNS